MRRTGHDGPVASAHTSEVYQTYPGEHSRQTLVNRAVVPSAAYMSPDSFRLAYSPPLPMTT
jgi:hypothetical protein